VQDNDNSDEYESDSD
jgi:putative ABC transport system ATP-binding protein